MVNDRYFSIQSNAKKGLSLQTDPLRILPHFPILNYTHTSSLLSSFSNLRFLSLNLFKPNLLYLLINIILVITISTYSRLYKSTYHRLSSPPSTFLSPTLLSSKFLSPFDLFAFSFIFHILTKISPFLLSRSSLHILSQISSFLSPNILNHSFISLHSNG